MAFGIRIEVWGEYASFNRPEMKVERVSYDVITPSAARGLLEAIYWKPQMRWVIDRLLVLAPIRFTHIRRNEIDQRIPAGNAESAFKGSTTALAIAIEDHRQQRAARILRDVRYGIEAHIEVLEYGGNGENPPEHSEVKYLEVFKRRATKGQFFHHPYMGCREFPAYFRLLGDGESFPQCPIEFAGEHDLGLMLWDVVFTEDASGPVIESNNGRRLRANPRFFRARIIDGVITVPPSKEIGDGL